MYWALPRSRRVLLVYVMHFSPVAGGGGGTQFVHGRSRMTTDPRIPTMPGRSTSGFHQPGRHCLHQARSAMRCSTSRMNGELHPSNNRSSDGLRHLVRTFLLIDDSADELLCFLVWLLQRQQWVLLCNCLVGALPYSHYVMRSLPLCGVRVLHPWPVAGGGLQVGFSGIPGI